MPGKEPQNPGKQAWAFTISPHSLSKNMWEDQIWPLLSSEPAANGSTVPGFLSPLSLPFTTAWDSLKTTVTLSVAKQAQ